MTGPDPRVLPREDFAELGDPRVLPRYDFAECAELLGIGEKTLRSRVADGTYPCKRNGRKVAFSVANVEAICALMESAPKAPAALVPAVTRRRRTA